MPTWIQNSPTDREEVRKRTFMALVAGVPIIRGWFGLSARKVAEKSRGKLQAKSVISSVFLSLAAAIGDWIQAVLDVKQSLFIEPPIPKGNRWVEHLRNMFRDYGLDVNTPNWSKLSTETVAQYEARLESYAQDLVDVFRKQNVTLEAIVSGLRKLLPADAIIELVEPYKLVKPWPSAKQYQINKLADETEAEFQTRLDTYDQAYRLKRKLARTALGAKPNSLYPLPVSTPVRLGTYDEDTSGVLGKRLALLKKDLGSYTNLDGTISRRYPSSRNQGGRLEITLSEDTIGATGIKTIYARLTELKAAGVYLTLYTLQFLGIAPTTTNQAPTVWDINLTDALFASAPGGGSVIGPFFTDP